MDPKWLGPYTITQVLGKGLYAMRDLRTNQLIQRVNGYHLKPYCTPPSSPLQVLQILCFEYSVSSFICADIYF